MYKSPDLCLQSEHDTDGATVPVYFKARFDRGQKKKCLVSGNPTDPTFLKPTLFFVDVLDLLLYFWGILNDFHAFLM